MSQLIPLRDKILNPDPSMLVLSLSFCIFVELQVFFLQAPLPEFILEETAQQPYLPQSLPMLHLAIPQDISMTMPPLEMIQSLGRYDNPNPGVVFHSGYPVALSPIHLCTKICFKLLNSMLLPLDRLCKLIFSPFRWIGFAFTFRPVSLTCVLFVRAVLQCCKLWPLPISLSTLLVLS